MCNLIFFIPIFSFYQRKIITKTNKNQVFNAQKSKSGRAAANH